MTFITTAENQEKGGGSENLNVGGMKKRKVSREAMTKNLEERGKLQKQSLKETSGADMA